jgi:hypothetical protein
MCSACGVFAVIGILIDAMSIDPQKIDANRPHVIEDAVEDTVPDIRWFKLRAMMLLDVIEPFSLALVS